MNFRHYVFAGVAALSFGVGFGMSNNAYADYDCLTGCRQDKIECNSDCGTVYGNNQQLLQACLNRCQTAFQACAQGCR
jgi:hypothetical protein